MKKMKHKTCLNLLLSSTLSIMFLFVSCEKFLLEKPNIGIAVPKTLDHLQGLLDNYSIMSQMAGMAAEASSDNYYLTETSYNSLSEAFQRLYTLEKDHLFSESHADEWRLNYMAIYWTNSVLSNIEKVDVTPEQEAIQKNIKGQALALRAQYFLRCASLWSLAYDRNTSSTDLGIPLKLSDDFNKQTVRSTNEETYRQIINDLNAAIPLLQPLQSHVLRASKAAAYGLLARTYLYMREYDLAHTYADSCLQIYDVLIDYNDVNPADAFPFKQFNEEVIFGSRQIGGVILSQANAKIPQALYDQFEDTDLRKTLFFNTNLDGSIAFRGFYEGAPAMFGGVATDEMYLTRAECAARSGDVNAAWTDLNTLLAKRYDDSFLPLHGDSEDALTRILLERRKQLLFRNLRWMDIKRLNKEGAGISVAHPLGDRVFKLEPNDLGFALAIPDEIILRAGIPQNPR